MEYIGKRISVKRTEGEVSIVILSTVDKMKRILLFCWLFLWSVCGVIVFAQFFILKDENTKAALIAWMGFWAYFEYKIFTAFLWRKFGMEKIKLREGKVFYKRDISGRGKVKIFEYDFVKDLRVIGRKDNSFFDNLNYSYWVVSGEQIAFDYYGKEIKLGIQLDEDDANELYTLLEKELG